MKEITANYIYAFIFLFGFVGELYSADAPLVGLSKIVHDATPLSAHLRKKVENYVGIYQLWEATVPTEGRCFVRKLSDKEFAAIQQNGDITVLDAQTGKHKRLARPNCECDIHAAEALSPQHIVLALERDVLRVVDLATEGRVASLFRLPDLPTCWQSSGLALLRGGSMPEVVVGDPLGCGISIFTIDLKNKKSNIVCHDLDRRPQYPQYITTLPDRKVRFTLSGQGNLDNIDICTLDVETANQEFMERPSAASALNRMIGKNLFVSKYDALNHGNMNLLHLLRNGKDLGSIPHGIDPQQLVVDIPGGFVTGFQNKLLMHDENGNVVQTLLADQEVREIRNHDDLLTAVSVDQAQRTTISAWHVGAVDEEKDDGGER